jgi:hypothetical protein
MSGRYGFTSMSAAAERQRRRRRRRKLGRRCYRVECDEAALAEVLRALHYPADDSELEDSLNALVQLLVGESRYA